SCFTAAWHLPRPPRIMAPLAYWIGQGTRAGSEWHAGYSHCSSCWAWLRHRPARAAAHGASGKRLHGMGTAKDWQLVEASMRRGWGWGGLLTIIGVMIGLGACAGVQTAPPATATPEPLRATQQAIAVALTAATPE